MDIVHDDYQIVAGLTRADRNGPEDNLRAAQIIAEATDSDTGAPPASISSAAARSSSPRATATWSASACACSSCVRCGRRCRQQRHRLDPDWAVVSDPGCLTPLSEVPTRDGAWG